MFHDTVGSFVGGGGRGAVVVVVDGCTLEAERQSAMQKGKIKKKEKSGLLTVLVNHCSLPDKL